jgi:Trypsin-co-occurring domain 2
MRGFVLRHVLASIAVLLPNVLPAQTKDAFPLAAVIAQVKKELAAAQNTPGQNAGLALQSVQITFALTQTTDANGKVAIGVPIISADLGINGDRKAETGSTLTVDLEPPSASVTMSGVDASSLRRNGF